MTKEEVIERVKESKGTQFILYALEPADFEGVEINDTDGDTFLLNHIDEGALEEIKHRTAHVLQKAIDNGSDFGDILYTAVKQCIQKVAKHYFEETDNG